MASNVLMTTAQAAATDTIEVTVDGIHLLEASVMTTSIQVDKPCSSEFNKEIAYLLDYARMKLLTEMPRQLRMVSYLRLCCIAIRKLQQQPELSSKNSLQVAFNDSYLYLLQALCQSSPEWWKYCWSSNRGILKSDDATIERLLQPLESFIDIHTCK